MTATKAFFLNILPTNDRREDLHYTKTLEKSLIQNRPLNFKYTLITVGDTRHDPWVLAQMAMQKDPTFSPLIAVNPFYQHPISVAKKLISLKSLYPNNLALNLVSGSFFNEMQRLGDSCELGARNQRLVEFLEALDKLLHSSGSCHFQGKFYQFQDVQLFPKVPGLQIDFFLSGTLEENLRPKNSSIFYVKNIRPWEDLKQAPSPKDGLSFGLCVRPTRQEAQNALEKLFPEDRKGQMLYDLAKSNTQTPWNQALQKNADRELPAHSLFSLKPAKNFWSSAPFLVGSYEEVAAEIKKYFFLGYNFFLLDFSAEDSSHVAECLKLADL